MVNSVNQCGERSDSGMKEMHRVEEIALLNAEATQISTMGWNSHSVGVGCSDARNTMC
jgi:hypothetical protein